MPTQLAEDVWWFDLTGVNAYLVNDDGTLTLVDTGWPFQERTIERELAALNLAVGDIDRVLITHYDVDHVGGLGRFDELDATVYIGRDDRPYLVDADQPTLTTRKGLFQRLPGFFVDAPEIPVEAVDDGDTIGSFTAYHTPGHTPGHSVYVSEALSVAFLGDTLMGRNGRLQPTPWFICADPQQVCRDVHDLDERLPDFEIACPGHGVPFGAGGRHYLREAAKRVEV